MILAVSTAVAVAYTIVLFTVLLVGPMAVTALKGQWVLFIVGWLTLGMVWSVTACRLARPDSWWARRFYGEDKLARAQRRYGVPPASRPDAGVSQG